MIAAARSRRRLQRMIYAYQHGIVELPSREPISKMFENPRWPHFQNLNSASFRQMSQTDPVKTPICLGQMSSQKHRKMPYKIP